MAELAVTPMEKLAAVREWVNTGIGATLAEDPSGFMLGIEAVSILGALDDIAVALRGPQACWCCASPIEPRDPDPWEGRMGGYCEPCAWARCDTSDSTCPVKGRPKGQGGTGTAASGMDSKERAAEYAMMRSQIAASMRTNDVVRLAALASSFLSLVERYEAGVPPEARTQGASLRVTCWACGKAIRPDKAPRALCVDCAYGGYFGGS